MTADLSTLETDVAAIEVDIAAVEVDLAAVKVKTDAIAELTEAGGTLTTDGTEQTLYVNETPAGVFKALSVFVDFTAHTGGETVVLRVYHRIKTGGNYIKEQNTEYAGAQDPDLIKVSLATNRYGVKVTAQKTAGTNRAYDWRVAYEI